ncbi:Prefoldin subunit-domain-containing protein [Syncephalis pseudoplumigaleata]|uniref:Prefoldin subunit 3 n=1 Tax=Syncephalis pseudoplumigaleata TaxID=1712513 RepID=A0A4P9Z196_9FUNG|nr:Prefoldin subunit-domain-containing protein [Syncephalis pseudoplumigaleata]|eukprot:RKP26263.1 Prefoldin subunit-domain-containing protein [Syncephalis pseudoplumigaleata]
MTTTEKNPRGIPKALFVASRDRPRGALSIPASEDVSAFLQEREGSAEAGLRMLQEVLSARHTIADASNDSKYRFMENSMQQRKRSLLSKIPEIQKTLQMAQYLEERKSNNVAEPMSVQYELHDTLYASARVQPRDTVYLWLGANVMLEYPIAEAISMLTEKLSAAQLKLSHTEEDLEFLRDQITVTEVSILVLVSWHSSDGVHH